MILAVQYKEVREGSFLPCYETFIQCVQLNRRTAIHV